MNHTIDFLRLAESDPLVLKVSALTDFLWPEFVRDAKPQVKYFADQFEIRQLSRFGKELFEFFYCGGEATPVVSLDDIEDYFRAKQDGLNPDAPKGFKPEYTLWSKILIDVANSPAYPAFQENCLGKHFESGNAAVCVLNELSDVLNEMLEENAQVHAALTSMAEELQGLRESFVEAMKAGDTTQAAELRQKGKELGESIEDILNNVHSTNKSEIDKSIEQAQKDSDSTSSALNCLAGDNEGFGVKLENVNEKQELASRLKKNKKLMDFARRLGAMKQAWNQRKRAKKHTSTYSDIVGANMSDDVTKAFPAELALAASKKGRALFALKHSQKTILTKDFEARSKELAQGPVVLYVDISGSMCGENELWSKAMAYVIAEECYKTKRQVQVHLFDTGIDQSITIEPRQGDAKDLLNFILAWYTRGGTSFDQVMRHACSTAEIDSKADGLIITDGQCQVTDNTVRKFNLFKDNNDIDVHAFCIGRKSASLEMFCDSVQTVDICEDAESADLFQKAIR